jgi:TatD DNase family protein
MLIDTHAHLNEPAMAEKLDAVVVRARNASVTGCVVPAYDRDSLARTALLAETYRGFIYPAYGIHPWFVDDDFDMVLLRDYLTKNNTVALGEIGLDFGAGFSNQEQQISVFRVQLAMAMEYGLPVIVHCRKAFDAMYNVMSACRPEIKGVMHSFSGSLELMNKFLDLGLYVSFSGSVTRKSARKYHRNAQAIHRDRYLLETDAPSIATESTVASEVEPINVVEVAKKMAELRNESYETICRQSTENAKRLFKIQFGG